MQESRKNRTPFVLFSSVLYLQDSKLTNCFQTEFLGCELRRSEAAREEAERKAAAAKEELVRWKHKAHQMEETREENDSLTTQVFTQTDTTIKAQ